jgi:hypothetical protein
MHNVLCSLDIFQIVSYRFLIKLIVTWRILYDLHPFHFANMAMLIGGSTKGLGGSMIETHRSLPGFEGTND